MDNSPARRIWQLDCTAITVVLAHGVPLGILRSCARDGMCKCCAHKLSDDAWVLEGVHKACHAENPISVRVESYLNAKHTGTIEEIRNETVLSIARRLSRRTLSPRETAGIAWALLTDSVKEKRKLGQRIMHALILRGAEGSFGPRLPGALLSVNHNVTVGLAGELN